MISGGKIAVTGGCGYIGSHTIVELLQSGFEVVSIDSLVNSNLDSLRGIEEITGKKITNHCLDLADQDVWRVLHDLEPDVQAVIHFAALKAVGESVDQPLRYYHNNINALINILKWMECAGIDHLVFSSSCTVYGETTANPINENVPFGKTASPYGKTKQMGEWVLEDCMGKMGKKALSLRYFNPAGAHESACIGESPINPALNLVPVITETAIGKRKKFEIFGNDYPTKDGTCIRDYIHVVDLAKAHVLALDYLLGDHQQLAFDAINLGMGEGLSVLELVRSFEQLFSLPLNYNFAPRRKGDVTAIFADPGKAKTLLNWNTQFGIYDILKTAWAWEQKRTKVL